MALTKAQARTLVQQYMDDPDGERWSTTGNPSNLDLALGLVYDDLWQELLEHASWLLHQRDALTSGQVTAPGFVDLSSAGPLTQRLFRLQKVFRDGREYSPADQKEVVVDQANSDLLVAQDRRYWFFGDELWLSPLDTGQGVELRYSFLPAAFTGLAEGTAIVWPDGAELAFVTNAAIKLMGKGSAEDLQPLASLATRSWQRLLSRLARRIPAPLVLGAPGGVFGSDRTWSGID